MNHVERHELVTIMKAWAEANQDILAIWEGGSAPPDASTNILTSIWKSWSKTIGRKAFCRFGSLFAG
jgi:hypothetical protein